jgi:SAM-dependent methyltransferase
MQRLTDVNYWEETWWSAERPRRLKLYRDFDFETVRLLKGIAGGEAARVLEVGAGGSRVLPYLRRRFGYEVFGSDFSLNGCRLLRANLALQGVDGGVICEDLFRSSLRSDWFDVVYSVGLIEHFDDTRTVIAEHLRLLRPAGRLVLIVPNLQGLQGRIVKSLAPALFRRHRVFGPEDLAMDLKVLGLESVRSGYLGSIFLHIGRDPQWSGVKRWPVWLQILIHGSVRAISGLVSLFCRLFPLRPHSRAFSTAFFAVGTKPAV